MKVTEIMYSGIAVRQLVYSFNKEFSTEIFTSIEMKEGNSFVTIDFGNTSKELIFKFSFKLGKTQKLLMKTREFMLPIGQYPLPPEENT
ncbi:hypothetical protein [Aquimarina agarivorans]|uniref:hypothetical protein n=1 Tax=Aquimarina agarivorans TaxID=980584 RepID=UPI000248F90F|nr:hypothetical protein [Aquimarina agarivorans]